MHANQINATHEDIADVYRKVNFYVFAEEDIMETLVKMVIYYIIIDHELFIHNS